MTAAMLLAVLVCSGSAMFAQSGELCERAECNFELFVPPRLEVECIETSCLTALVRVKTNCETIICIECDPAFVRFERDCEGKILSSKDEIAADHLLSKFCELDTKCDGAPLEVKQIEKDCWNVCSHNGGYEFTLVVFPKEAATLCDDCGCYELTCEIRVCTVPVEHCECPIVICE
jgi:hypothetical protein